MPWDDGSFFPAEERAAEVLDEAGLVAGEAWIHSTRVAWRDKLNLEGETFWVELMNWVKPPSDPRRLFVTVATATDRLKGDVLLDALRRVCEALAEADEFEVSPEEEGKPIGGRRASPWKQGGEYRAWSVRILDDHLIL